MIIAVTGEPKSGKSTFIQKFVERLEDRSDVFGFFTQEIREDGVRTGFKMVGSNSLEAVIADTINPTEIKVGRFYVHKTAIDMFTDELNKAHAKDFLYMDEIGQMQLTSDSYRRFVEQNIGEGKDALVALSTVFQDPLIDRIKAMPSTFLFKFTQENRADVLELAIALHAHRITIKNLNDTQRNIVRQLFDSYIAQNNLVSLRKLLQNALAYVSEEKVIGETNYTYLVRGRHDMHTVVVRSRDDWSCDCKLGRGGAPYDAAAECSHLQAALLFAQA